MLSQLGNASEKGASSEIALLWASHAIQLPTTILNVSLFSGLRSYTQIHALGIPTDLKQSSGLCCSREVLKVRYQNTRFLSLSPFTNPPLCSQIPLCDMKSLTHPLTQVSSENKSSNLENLDAVLNKGYWYSLPCCCCQPSEGGARSCGEQHLSKNGFWAEVRNRESEFPSPPTPTKESVKWPQLRPMIARCWWHHQGQTKAVCPEQRKSALSERDEWILWAEDRELGLSREEKWCPSSLEKWHCCH